MVKFGEEVENELRTQVIQAREVKPGVFGGYYKDQEYCSMYIINILTVKVFFTFPHMLYNNFVN